jgi:PAS domain S-box-containing protein
MPVTRPAASLHARLMLAMALLGTVLAVGSSFLLIERERERRALELEGRATRIAELFSHSLAQPLWNVDRKSIDNQLAALAPNPEVAQFSVTAVNYGTVAEVTKVSGPELDNGVVQVRVINYEPPVGTGPQKIGEVRVVLTRAVAARAVAEARRAILLLVGSVVALLYAMTYVLLRRMVSRPIQRLETTVERISGGDFDARCVVESGDELGRLGLRVNDMADRLRDFTQRLRESESKYRGIFENALEGIFGLDRDGRLRDANPAVARLLGYADPQQLMASVNGDRGDDASSPRGRLFTPEQVDALFEALDRDGEIGGMELQLTRADGSPIWIQLSARPRSDADGSSGASASLIGLISDVTARKLALDELHRHRERLEQAVQERTAQLVRAKEQAEVANSTKTAFLTQMSHELRTPLNGILGFAQILLRDKSLGERQSHAVRTIEESGQHLLTLITDILDWARMDVAKMELFPDDVPLASFLAIVVDIMQVKAEEKNLLFVHDFAPDLPATLHVDDKRLRQILLNLLSNAVKFTDAGQVTLRVKRQPTQRHGGRPASGDRARLRFEVEDTGIGMTRAQVDSLFQPFEQVAEKPRREGGTGLGLAISRQLVRLMGGDIGMRSEPGQGSLFWFELELPASDSATALPRKPRGVPVGYEGRRLKVLVVDDVPQNRAMLVESLGSLGFEVFDAGDGQQALDRLHAMEPDVVVMDIMMPVLDGLQATRCIRSLPRFAELPIIAASASVTPQVQEAARQAGANAFLAKPIEQDALLETVGRLLDLRWIYGEEFHEADIADPGSVPGLPLEYAEALHRLARVGNMRRIHEFADELQDLDAHFAALAQQLRLLADACQSKAILRLAEQCRRAANDRATV